MTSDASILNEVVLVEACRGLIVMLSLDRECNLGKEDVGVEVRGRWQWMEGKEYAVCQENRCCSFLYFTCTPPWKLRPHSNMCGICDTTCRNADGVAAHKRDSHPCCPTCSQLFARTTELEGH